MSFIFNLDMKDVVTWVHTSFKDEPQEAMMNAYRQQMKLALRPGIDWDDLTDVTIFVGGNLEKDPAFLGIIRGG